jgi:hypothetical protein
VHGEYCIVRSLITGIIRATKLRRMRWTGNVACMEMLVGTPERKRQLGRARRRWEEDIRMLRVGKYGLDEFGSVQSSVAGSSEHGNEPSSSVKDRKFLDQVSDY